MLTCVLRRLTLGINSIANSIMQIDFENQLQGDAVSLSWPFPGKRYVEACYIITYNVSRSFFGYREYYSTIHPCITNDEKAEKEKDD